MIKLSPIVYLKDTLPEDSWSWVIPALRQDPLIWDSLQEIEFLKSAIRNLDGQPKKWSPMNLALLSLGIGFAVDELIGVSLEELSPYLHQQSVQAYKTFTSDSPPTLDLKMAGLLALYFSEHPVKGKLTAPRTSLACLYELLHNPLDYFSQINPEDTVQIILSNPLKFAEQKHIFSQLLDRYDQSGQSELLQTLSLQNPTLAAEVTEGYLAKGGTPPQGSSLDFKNNNLDNLSALMADADIQSIAKHPGEHLNKAKEAWKEAGQLQTNLAARMVALEASKGDLQSAHNHWLTIKDNITIDQVTNILMTLCDEGYIDEALNWYENDIRAKNLSLSDPEHFLLHGLLLEHKGDTSGALNAAEYSLAGFTDQNLRPPDYTRTLAKLFLRLGHPQKALEAVELIIEVQPNNEESIDLLLESFKGTSQQDQAIKAAHLAVAIQPKKLDKRRDLAQTMETAGYWSSAVAEREAILAMQESPTMDDKYSFAAAALKAGHPQDTADVCKKLIQDNPNDPDAHFLLGSAYSDIGDLDNAKTHLLESTQIAPSNAKPWLALANIYQETNQKPQRLETLQAASSAIPNSPEISLALGEIFLEDNTPTAALAHFRLANKLLKDDETLASRDLNSKVALALGKTLLQLGHSDEALSALKEAYSFDQDNMEIAHGYARALMASGSPEKAIPIFKVTRIQQPTRAEVHMDFAKACLAVSNYIEEAKDALIAVLEIDPSNTEAKAYLAEAYQVNQELDKAIEAYTEALDSPLQDDPYWNAKLSLGLGQVSLAAGEPETAIATLKNALLKNGDDVNILKTLSTAYLEAGLKENALWAAHSVMEKDPDNEEHLEWFINQAITLGSTDKAIDVLSKYLADNPRRPSLIAKMGWLHVYNGNHETARDYFVRIKALEQVSPPDLYQAAQGLLEIEDPLDALDILNKAISICEKAGDQTLLPQLYMGKSQAYQMNSDLDNALETLTTAMEKSPENHLLYQKKAEIYLDMKQQDAATVCLEDGIKKFPNDTDLRLEASIIHRANGNLETAFDHAKQALDLFANLGSGIMKQSDSAVIADLTDAMMQKNIAMETIEQASIETETSKKASIDYYCLKGELALESGEEIAATSALTKALNASPNHPRVLALQTRLTAKQGDFETAERLFSYGLKSVAGSPETDKNKQVLTNAKGPISQLSSTYIALAEAALALGKWDEITNLLRKAVEIAPNEPRSHFKLARALVISAENQRLCQLLDIISHAPGQSATGDIAYKQFEDSILKAAHLLTEYFPANEASTPADIDTNNTITSWLARGHAIFQPSTEHAQALAILPKSAGNLTALLAAFRHCGDLKEAEKTAGEIYEDINEYATEPDLLGQIAIALTKNAPETALDAIKTAIEVSIWRNMVNRPVFHAIKAYIANRSQNLDLQLTAIKDAIDIWSDEPNWLSKAADLNLRLGDPDGTEKAIHYLEQAVELEPDKAAHYLKLGEAQQKLGNLKDAVSVLDQATRVLPQQTEPWMELARIYRLDKSIPQAIRCAKNVTQIDPSLPEPQILLAELSLEVDNPEKASDYINGVLEQNPENTKALLLQSEIYKTLNKPVKALTSLDKAIPMLPKSIPLNLKRIQLIQEVDGPKQAVEELEILSDEYPQDPQVLAALAEALESMNDLEGSIKKAQSAISHGIQDLDEKEHIHMLQLLGRNLRKSGNLDQAIHNLSQAVEKAPDLPDPYIELGRCYQEQRQFERSQQMMQKAIEARPADPQGYYFSGLLFKEIKDFENAETMFRQAAKLAPTNLNIHRQLGAVTAINLVQNRHGHSSFGQQSRLASTVEGMEK